MFTLIDLPYALDALEPVISARTLEFHHGKHLAGYVANLNKLLPGSEFEGLSLEEIVRKAPAGPVFNNAGQIYNHEMYFGQFKAAGGGSASGANAGDGGAEPGADAPAGAFRARLEAQWGSLEAFQADFEAKGAGLFGSGWVWLSADSAGALHITQEPGAATPLARGLRPLLTFDVWEHAYYLDYQNRRPDHLRALWPLVDWSVVAARYAAAD